jgi:hypothetical protein
MKPQGSFTGSSAWLVGRSQSNPADHLLQRVRVVTQELEAIQNEMCAHLAASDGTPRKNAFIPDSAAGSDLHIFKAVVDQMRRILWFYTGDAKLDSQGESSLSESSSPLPQKLSNQNGDSDFGGASFFERLNVVIDGYIQADPAVTSRRFKL